MGDAQHRTAGAAAQSGGGSIPQDLLYREMGLGTTALTSTLLKESGGHVKQQGIPVDTAFVRGLVGRCQAGNVE